jgi:hypothetical protein
MYARVRIGVLPNCRKRTADREWDGSAAVQRRCVMRSAVACSGSQDKNRSQFAAQAACLPGVGWCMADPGLLHDEEHKDLQPIE